MKYGLQLYIKENHAMPSRVVIYRDGVGEGMISHVYDYELQQIKDAVAEIKNEKNESPKLVYTTVSKRVNARFFHPTRNGIINPSPGTVVDSLVTRRGRSEFFLISQQVRQGTVSPTSYNIIEDQIGWPSINHQTFAYKMSYLYYNYTVSNNKIVLFNFG